MATPVRNCLRPSCRELIPFTQTYCEKHTGIVNKEYDEVRKRDSPEYIRFYNSKEWRSLRKVSLLRDESMCLSCLDDDIYTQAQMVDHIIPIKEEWEKRLELINTQSLCWSCHNSKTFSKES